MKKLLFSFFVIICACVFFSESLYGQSNVQMRYVGIGHDTLRIDSLSIAPNSFKVLDSANNELPDSVYYVDLINARFYAVCRQYMSLKLMWRQFPLSLGKAYYIRPRPILMTNALNDSLHKTFIWPRPSLSSSSDEVSQTQIETNGSITRGLSSGSNQDVFMNSNLNLQLSGKLTNTISVQGAVADNNVPFQPNGNTQQLQDFDKVYIRFFTPQHELIVGDYESSRNESVFLRYYKKSQGAKARLQWDVSKASKFETETAMAISKGKTCVQRLATQEGNQGPYRLTGCENELYIIILSGTERVYLDGVLLQRGEMLDYVIDYNMGEIRFTAKRLITKDSRVSVEFEYSDKNYARFLLNDNTVFKTQSSRTSIGLYSEFDNKNQPYQIILSDSTRSILASAGNAPAMIPSAVRDTTFNRNVVYYRKTDTVVGATAYMSIFVYTTRRDDVRYRLTFSYVGANKGYYKAEAANNSSGKKYVWYPPLENGLLQGDYMPVTMLITPKLKQVIDVNHEQTIGRNTKFSIELGVSENDQNTFSSIGDDHAVGFAVQTKAEQIVPVRDDQICVSAGNTFVQQYFNGVAPLHSSEFLRDWNISETAFQSNENMVDTKIAYRHLTQNEISYGFQNLQRPLLYRGNKHGSEIRWSIRGFSMSAQGSLLQSSAVKYNTNFIRDRLRLQQIIWKPVAVWYENEQERNIWLDTLQQTASQSYRFYKNGLYLGTPDTVLTGFKVGGNSRTDYLMASQKLVAAYRANDVVAGAWWPYQAGALLRVQTTWRKLQVLDSTITRQAPQQTVLTVLEHRNSFVRRSLQSTLYYETGAGLEAKKEYSFVEVAPGLGTFVWNSTTDYNHDGIPQLNEFEAARYQYQANYIRVARPTNSYQSVHTSRISHTLNFDCDKLFTSSAGWQSFVARFSDKCFTSIEQKNLAAQTGWWHNPVQWNRTDSLLQMLSATLRNSLYFNRLSNIWSTSYTFQKQENKQLTALGFENRSIGLHQSSSRLTVFRQFTSIFDYERGSMYSMPQLGFMQNHCFDIRHYSCALKFLWQPNFYLSFSIQGGFTKKENQIPENEVARLTRITQENTLSHPKYGRISTQVSLVFVRYDFPTNTSLAYTLLEALLPGRNYIWTCTWQRDVTKNIQINLRYEGQRLASGTTIHAGTLVAKAFF